MLAQVFQWWIDRNGDAISFRFDRDMQAFLLLITCPLKGERLTGFRALSMRMLLDARSATELLRHELGCLLDQLDEDMTAEDQPVRPRFRQMAEDDPDPAAVLLVRWLHEREASLALKNEPDNRRIVATITLATPDGESHVGERIIAQRDRLNARRPGSAFVDGRFIEQAVASLVSTVDRDYPKGDSRATSSEV